MLNLLTAVKEQLIGGCPVDSHSGDAKSQVTLSQCLFRDPEAKGKKVPTV